MIRLRRFHPEDIELRRQRRLLKTAVVEAQTTSFKRGYSVGYNVGDTDGFARSRRERSRYLRLEPHPVPGMQLPPVWLDTQGSATCWWLSFRAGGMFY